MKKVLMFFGFMLTVVCFAHAQKPVIKEATFSDKDLTKIQEILKDADASTYTLAIEQNGKVTRLGSAGMRGLSKVSAYHKAGGKASAANEIITTVDNYIKTVWTSRFEKMYPDKVKQINQIMEASLVRKR